MAGAKSNSSSPERLGALTVSAVLTAAVLALSAVVLFWFDPSRHGFYPQCLFHRSTGLLCPGCGSLRAVHQLLHGHLAAAFHDNALLISSLPLLGVWGVNCLVRKVRRQPVTLSIPPIWLWTALVVLVVFGIARNLPVEAVAWLRP